MKVIKTNNFYLVKNLDKLHAQAYAVSVALEAIKDNTKYIKKDWVSWAEDWLSGKNRSVMTAQCVNEDIWDYVRTRPSHTCYNDLVLREAAVAAVSTNLDLRYLVQHSNTIDPSVAYNVLFTKFLCPHCHKQESEHTSSGKCLFGAHSWPNFEGVWRDLCKTQDTK